jgi:hypothetical protein
MIQLSMTQSSRFTSEIVPISQRVTDGRDESTAPEVADAPTMAINTAVQTHTRDPLGSKTSKSSQTNQ